MVNTALSIGAAEVAVALGPFKSCFCLWYSTFAFSMVSNSAGKVAERLLGRQGQNSLHSLCRKIPHGAQIPITFNGMLSAQNSCGFQCRKHADFSVESLCVFQTKIQTKNSNDCIAQYLRPVIGRSVTWMVYMTSLLLWWQGSAEWRWCWSGGGFMD